jgi:hypothetical protein
MYMPRRIVIQLASVIFIFLITGCSSINSTPTITPSIKPVDTTTPIPTATLFEIPTPGLFTVFAPHVKIRKFPNLSSSVVLYLEEGQQVTAICGVGSDKNWCIVVLKNGKLVPFKFLPAYAPGYSGPDGEGWIWGGCLGIGSDCK